MDIYRIHAMLQQAIDSQIDPETGELLPGMAEVLDLLEMERDTKIDNLAAAVKNLRAEAEAVKAEADELTRRHRQLSRRAEGLAMYLAGYMYSAGLPGFSSARNRLSWRTSTAVEITDEAAVRAAGDQYLRQREPDIDKTAIKQAIQWGIDVPGAALVQRKTLQIK